MSFLSPGYLAALALVGLPLLIHLIRRRKLRIVPWAAMEFLRQSQRRRRRRLRIEELILLAVRMTIVALVVAAFAQPVIHTIAASILGQNAPVYAVIVLDNSVSMGQVGPEHRTSWERGVAAARVILSDALRPGDSASLVLASDRVTPLVGAPSFDLRLVNRRLGDARLSDRATDYVATARAVDQLLARSHAPYKEVYWITDNQASGFGRAGAGDKSAWQSLGGATRIVWIDAGAPADARDNLAVQLRPLARELVTPDLPARLEAEVYNFGRHSRQNLLVELHIDESLEQSTRISLPADGSRLVTFTPNMARPGPHAGAVQLSDPQHTDNLAEDNSAPFVIRSRSHIDVLIQEDSPPDIPDQSGALYLMSAFAPGGAATGVLPTLHHGSGLGGLSLRPYQAVVVSDLSSVDPEESRALEEFVRGGGGLLIFPGPSVNAARVNAALAGLLPANLTGLQRAGAAGPVSLNPASIGEGPALAAFKQNSSIDLGTASFTSYEALAPLPAAAGAVRVMVRFTNGDPAFVERTVGLGRVILAASSAGTAWNTLPLKPAFVPILYQMVTYLSAGAGGRHNLNLGDTLFGVLPLQAGHSPVRIQKPDGQVETVTPVLDARGVTFTYSHTEEAGIYRATGAGGYRDAFAVAPEAGESNLAAVQDIRATLQHNGVPPGKLEALQADASLANAVRAGRYGTAVWRTAIWLAICLLFLEALLAQRFGRRG